MKKEENFEAYEKKSNSRFYCFAGIRIFKIFISFFEARTME